MKKLKRMLVLMMIFTLMISKHGSMHLGILSVVYYLCFVIFRWHWICLTCFVFRWEPDPVEADPLKGSLSQRKVNILGLLVDIIGSKEQLVNEYRVMLAEKLLNKTDYDIDTEIRTGELLKVISIFFTIKVFFFYQTLLKFNLGKLLVYFLHCCILVMPIDTFWRS